MLRFIDRWIEKVLLKRLHKNRDKLITKHLDDLRKSNPSLLEPELIEIINHEIDRTFAVADRTIIRGKIKTAKYTFWITAVTGCFIVGAISGFTFGAALPFLAPLITAFIAYTLTLATIPISYNQEVRGHIDSTILDYEKSHSSRSQSANTQRIIQILEEHKDSRIVINILPALAEEKAIEPQKEIAFNQTTNLFQPTITVTQHFAVNTSNSFWTPNTSQSELEKEIKTAAAIVANDDITTKTKDVLTQGYRRLN